MSEQVSVCAVDSPLKCFPEDRSVFYAEQTAEFKKSGVPSKAVEVVYVILCNKSGELLIQKRSSTKNHNPNLLDKTIGGHVQFGDKPYYTVMIESVQELQTPSIVLNTKEEFNKTFQLLQNYLDTIAVIYYNNVDIISLPKIIKDEKIIIASKAHVFFGVYGGATKPVDREAKGVLLYSFEEVEKEIEQNKDSFTDDFVYLFTTYKKEIKEFIDLISLSA
jgi:isopentenyldiphosphate isomerase